MQAHTVSDSCWTTEWPGASRHRRSKVVLTFKSPDRLLTEFSIRILPQVVLATNIAESSITIAGVYYVLDLCRTNQLAWNLETSKYEARVVWASKSQVRKLGLTLYFVHLRPFITSEIAAALSLSIEAPLPLQSALCSEASLL